MNLKELNNETKRTIFFRNSFKAHCDILEKIYLIIVMISNLITVMVNHEFK